MQTYRLVESSIGERVLDKGLERLNEGFKIETWLLLPDWQ